MEKRSETLELKDEGPVGGFAKIPNCEAIRDFF
jgi:hypothetical protein